MGCKRFLFLFSVLVPLMLAFFSYVHQPMHWVYDTETLHQIAKDGIARAGADAPAERIVEEVIKGVMETYPQVSRNTGRWIWNNAGGAMGSMTVLHASFSEYLIIFGTPLGTEGHTGRYHWTEDFFYILVGEQWAALPGAAEKEVYRQGDVNYLPRATAKQYRMPDECFALEYARGNIVAMLPFGFFDGLFSTVDFVTLYHTFMESAGNFVRNTLNGKI